MKYNWSIIGHEKQLERLEEDIASGNLSHAYLLSGANSVGKYTVAKKMAGILQCENNFCHECPACLQVEKGSHIDTIELRGKRESIKIDEVRKLMERLNMTRQSPYKILLIQSLERMTTEAANSFLKMLEEPPQRTIFIMTTDNVRALLPTIISRVRMLKFAPDSYQYLVEKLRELYPNCDEETLKRVGLFSAGKTGMAVHLMENPDSLASHVEVYHRVQNFLERRNVADRFSYVDELAKAEKTNKEVEEEAVGPDRIDIFFNMLTHVLRSKILEGSPLTDSHIKTLSKIGEAGMLLKKNVNSRLVLENLMLDI